MSSLLSSTRNTRPLRAGSLRFLRSDVPAALSEGDLLWLREHDVRTVIDLRSAEECVRKPCPLEGQPGFYYYHRPVTGGDRLPSSTAEVAASYIAMADASLWATVRIIETAPTNVLYFCNAGKDRTGVISAILLARMGAGREEIVQDYLRSADNLKGMLAAFAAQNPEVDVNIITPQRAYIEGFLDALPAMHSPARMAEVTGGEALAVAGAIHSASWQESHRAFCAEAFVALHTPAHQRDYLAEELAQGKRLYLLIDKEPVGIVSVKDSLIENLYVLPKAQGKGIGTALLLFALAQCDGTPRLWILENNDRARTLYAKYGFRPTGASNRLSETISEIEMARGGV